MFSRLAYAKTRRLLFAPAKSYDVPVITSVSPSTGTTAGGTDLIIVGDGFLMSEPMTVLVGGLPAANVKVGTTGRIFCKAPAHGAGAVDVVVTTPGGTARAVNAFTFVAPFIDPATLSLPGWWRAPVVGTNWVGQPSLGSSGARDLGSGGGFVAGAPLNGYAPASFNGSSYWIENVGVAISDVFSSAFSFAVLINPSALAADDGGIDLQPKIFGDSQSYWSLLLSASGAQYVHYDTGIKRTPYVPVGTGAWIALFGQWDGSRLYLAKNSDAFGAGVLAAAPGSTSGILRVATNYNATHLYSGLLAEIIFDDIAWSPTTRDGIRLYFNDRYGLSL